MTGGRLSGALPAQVGPPAARDYLQDGLVSLFDGVENAGYGRHDAAAASRLDLAKGRETPLLDSSAVYGDGVSVNGTLRIGGTGSGHYFYGDFQAAEATSEFVVSSPPPAAQWFWPFSHSAFGDDEFCLAPASYWNQGYYVNVGISPARVFSTVGQWGGRPSRLSLTVTAGRRNTGLLQRPAGVRGKLGSGPGKGL